MTLAEVRSLDAGSHAGPRFAGEPVPTYPETLEALRGSGATLILDIKQGAMLDNERRSTVRRSPSRATPGRDRDDPHADRGEHGVG